MSQSVAKIKDVCEFVRGLTYSKSDEVEFSKNAVLRATNIDLNSNRLNLTDIRYIKDSVNVKADKKVKVNDILICTASGSKSHLGKVALIEEPLDMAFGGFMGVLRTKPNINPKFLFAFFKSDIFLKHVFNIGDGANINNLKFSQIEDLEFNLPSLPTQQRIVAKLDAIFAEIDKVTAAAETNSKNAEALFQSYLTQVFERGGDGWQRMEIGSISKVLNGYAFKSTDFNSENGVKCLKITNVGIREFVSDANEYLPNSFAINHSNFLVKEGSIVIPLTRTIIGGGLKVAIVPVGFHNSLLNQRVASIEVMHEIIDRDLVYYYLCSSIVRSYVLSHVNTLMQPNLSIKDLLSMPVPIPLKELQSRIKNTISFSIDSIFQIKDLNIKKINECNFLKQSILKQAFNGELIKE